MKVEVSTDLVAETDEDAKILAEEFNRLYGKHGTKATKMWRLTLPKPGGGKLGTLDSSRLGRLAQSTEEPSV